MKKNVFVFLWVTVILMYPINSTAKSHRLNTVMANEDFSSQFKSLASKTDKESPYQYVRRLIETVPNMESKDRRHRTLLRQICKSSHFSPQERKALVKLLIGKGADVNAKTLMISDTPLMMLASNTTEGSVEIAKMLIEAGADVNAKNVNGETPFFLAAKAGNPQLAKFLATKGAVVNTANSQGQTPLYWVNDGWFKDRGFITKLLNKINVNKHDNLDLTPLHMAAHFGQTETIKLFLDAGAKINPLSKQWQTPLDMAEGEIATLLKKYGAKTAKELFGEKFAAGLQKAIKKFIPNLPIPGAPHSEYASLEIDGK